jgi:putative ABC transport system permease protein
MEEHVWSLVELFLAGEAADAEINELTYLLGTHPHLLDAVKEFLREYKDENPQVTTLQRQELIAKAENISKEYALLSAKGLNGHSVPAAERRHVRIPVRASKKHVVQQWFNNEARAFGQLLKTTYRQIRLNRTISFINISGLAIGMATAILIFLWVFNELSYDNFHVNRDRVYLLYNESKINGKLEADFGVPSVAAHIIKTNYPQVEEVNRMSGVGSFVLKNGDKRFESKGILTDANFFKLFTFPLSEGNPATALLGPHDLILSQEMALKLFGTEDAVGKIVRIDSVANFTVTGVLKPLPANTNFRFDYIVPASYMREVHWEQTGWQANNLNVYVLLRPGVDKQVATNMFRKLYHDQGVNPGTEIKAEPMATWALYQYDNGKFVPGSLVIVRWFALIACLIMLIACINYMNLGTARSAKRAKEVGIRKVAGANRGLLVRQFLGESVITSFIAGMMAILIAQLCLPAFNSFVDNHLALPYGSPVFWLSVLGFVLFTGVIAGSYPAFYLSAYRPIKVLKGILTSAGALIAPRKVLVVVQFTVAIGFIICTVIIYRQVDFALHRSKGYDPYDLGYMYIKGDMAKNYTAIEHDLQESGAISSMTRTNSPVNDLWTSSTEYKWQGKNPIASIELDENYTDKNFTQTTGITLLEGRDIDVSRYPTDTAAVLLTQTAVTKMGLKDPVGQLMYRGQTQLHIVGVIKDFVAGWAYVSNPIIIRGTSTQFGAINIRLNAAHTASANLSKINAILTKYNPDYPFVYHFVSENNVARMQDDVNFGTFAAVFTGLTIFISCMGLFALAAFMAENKIKEIGIRKVLGASVTGIATLLSRDFVVLVGVSFAIASPIAWWLMSKWLQNYPLHIHMDWWIFALTGGLSLFIALLTVGFQALKAAMLSPVKSLRSE